MDWDAEEDARGRRCPMPVLRAGKRLRAMPPGAVLRLIADDPMAAIDVPHFCAEQGHDLLAEEALGSGAHAWLIRRGALRPESSDGAALRPEPPDDGPLRPEPAER